MGNNISKPTATYKMTLSLNVLNHLGLNLYSNFPAVLSEAVANAWDADARVVKIDIDDSRKQITITDDGDGMTIQDVNNKFLTVGYRRRKDGLAMTDGMRPVMGRKGIGKLSLFSVAEQIDVYSVKDGQKHGFRMSLPDIINEIETKNGIYEPKPLTDFPDDLAKGTRICISNFRRKLHQPEKHLRRRLARRFSIIGNKHSFEIEINGTPIGATDRDYFHKIQYLWTYDEQENEYSGECKDLDNHDARSYQLSDGLALSGWIGTVKESGSLKDSSTEDNLNKITVMVRGKIAQEDILEEFAEGGIYTKYIMGELHAEFLDNDSDDDITTSNRQKILEDDPRYILLKEFVLSELKYFQSKWTELRTQAGAKKALEIPAIKKWYSTLGQDNKKRARSLFGKISSLTVNLDEERRTLLKHGILAFESLRAKENLDRLDQLDGSQFEEFIKVFDNIDDIEATLYRQIIVSRVEVIRALKDKVDTNSKERILQEHIYEHLWLLDAGWERAKSSELMEQNVDKEFQKIDAKLTDEEKNGRIDIKYRTTANKHLIIELKRADRTVSASQLIEQCDKYRKALRKLLRETKRDSEAVEIVCVVGRELSDWETPEYRQESIDSMEKKHIRVVLYQELIDSALESYKAYLDKDIEIGRISELIQQIDSDMTIS